jgi:Ca2+-transporting ATPase
LHQNYFNIAGLHDDAVRESREKSGTNQIHFKKENWFLKFLAGLWKEPMILLLMIAAALYFITGNFGDGIFLCAAILLVAAISLFQDTRSRNALRKLEIFTQPVSTVIRNHQVLAIASEELVLGDFIIVEEGGSIAADAIIKHSNDFSVNESILTGESLNVYKDANQPDPFIYKGTTVVSGLAVAEITAIGNQTRLAKIGISLETIKQEKTPLELQISGFVKKMAVAGGIIFIVVWAINYFKTYSVIDSFIKALTLAMSILPEEIPVAFTSFMALGAWRLMKEGIIVKQMKTVEALGSATVICVDKTGTITQNKMQFAQLFVFPEKKLMPVNKQLSESGKHLIRSAMWASEPIPFDPMELEIHQAYKKYFPSDERKLFRLVHEYPLGGHPPMMTHVFENHAGIKIIAAKGAPEAILKVSVPDAADQLEIESKIKSFSSIGYRVLAVATATTGSGSYPKTQQEIPFTLQGLIAFYDPPKENISRVFEQFEKAGIAVKIITGDHELTTKAIAKEIHFPVFENSLNGTELLEMPENILQEKVKSTNIFCRVFPEAKYRIINALKANGEVVAMTGDGVNDGPALKTAQIGIAMGKKGTEIAKQAASLILMEDDLSKMPVAIAMGRKIYTNLKKAIRYIISIHIPIILTVFIPLALGWVYPSIFSPVHIIFLELIMGPTCSIIYENEPIEKNSMLQKPRPVTLHFFNPKELLTSILQGLCITAGILFVYQYSVQHSGTEMQTRTMVFLTLIVANIFLTLVNRSFHYSIFTTLRYQNYLVPVIIAVTALITFALISIAPLAGFFLFCSISISQILICLLTGFVSVTWFELVKWYHFKKIAFPANF